MAARKKRGARRHKGVVLMKPEPGRGIGWRARFTDPDTGRSAKVSLPAELTTAEQRETWAVAKAREFAKRRLELEGGAVRKTGMALTDAVERYFNAHTGLRPRTLEIYRMKGTDKLLAWADREGLDLADDLTKPKLLAFRESIIAEPKHAVARGSKRGQRRATDEPRSAYTINQELRSVRTVLGYLCELELLPRLNEVQLGKALKCLKATVEHVEYLKPAECRVLLEAALRHDAETFDETREEHAGGRLRGTTPRYEPVAPLVAFLLITGCRFGEAVTLEWSQVDLDALDHEGHKGGEIQLRGAGTKTRRARTVGLEVSPALRAMLAAMKLRTGGQGRVFGASRGAVTAAKKRLRAEYGAPPAFTWQVLRSTCACYLTNAPGIFGAASAYRSAKQLGHAVQVAEKHYTDVLRGIPREARTLEAAMQIEDVMRRVVGAVGEGGVPMAQPLVSAGTPRPVSAIR